MSMKPEVSMAVHGYGIELASCNAADATAFNKNEK